ncbi:hypothetical protein J6590_100771 [Homalodisca vitripennis]|nr:hypothetical protein J6590_100771 [Homalodisca vitripennis]
MLISCVKWNEFCETLRCQSREPRLIISSVLSSWDTSEKFGTIAKEEVQPSFWTLTTMFITPGEEQTNQKHPRDEELQQFMFRNRLYPWTPDEGVANQEVERILLHDLLSGVDVPEETNNIVSVDVMGPCELVTAAREKKFSSSKKLSCGSQLGATECIPVGGIPRRQGIRCCLQGHLQSQDIYVGIHGHQALLIYDWSPNICWKKAHLSVACRNELSLSDTAALPYFWTFLLPVTVESVNVHEWKTIKVCDFFGREEMKALTHLDNGETIKMVNADLEVGEVTCNKDVQMELSDDALCTFSIILKNLTQTTVIAYIEHEEESTPLDLRTLQRWRYITATKRGKS